jgi:hypothetical protein
VASCRFLQALKVPNFLFNRCQFHIVVLLLRLEPVPECGFKHRKGVASVVVGGDPLLEALDGVGVILGLEGEVSQNFLFLAQHAHQFLLYLHEPSLLLLHCLPHALLQFLYV